MLGDNEKATSLNHVLKPAITSKKRIREVSNSLEGVLEYQSVRNGSAARSTLSLRNEVTVVKQTSNGQSAVGRMVESTEQTRVTPSPHLTPPAAPHNAFAALSESRLNYISSRPVASDSQRHLQPEIRNYPNYHKEQQPIQQARTPTFRGTSNFCHRTDQLLPSRHFSQVSHSSSTSNKLSQADSWKRLKHQQQKSQQRAFVRNSDNPFQSYKHDPNDTESYLDQLVSSSHATTPTSASIIPPEAFLATQNQSHFYSRNAIYASYRNNAKDILSRRKQRQGHAVSIRDILSQKAAESNIHNMRTTHGSIDFLPPIFPNEQSIYPHYHENPLARPPYGGDACSLSSIVNSHGTDLSQSLHGDLADINHFSNRHTNMYQGAAYTHIPVYSGYAISPYEDEHPQLQYDLRRVSGTASMGRRDGSVRNNTEDQNNLEHAFF